MNTAEGGGAQSGAVMAAADDMAAVETWLAAERLDADVQRTLQAGASLLVLK